MSSKWFAKHFACWSGREQKDRSSGQQQQSKEKKQKQLYDEQKPPPQQVEKSHHQQPELSKVEMMSIAARNSKRFGQQNCAKDGVVKCCDKFCKNHCNLSMIRNDLKGAGGRGVMIGNRRSFNGGKSSNFKCLWWFIIFASFFIVDAMI